MGAGLLPVTSVHQGPLAIYRLEVVVTYSCDPGMTAVPGNTFLNVLKMPFLAGVNS